MIKLYAFRNRTTGDVDAYHETRSPLSIWIWFNNLDPKPVYAINIKLKEASWPWV